MIFSSPQAVPSAKGPPEGTQMDDLLDRRVGPETCKTYRRRIESGFISAYLSGAAILDIGFKGDDPLAQPIVPLAIGVDVDYPGYDGKYLPFADDSQDAVHSSHCLEHIRDYQSTLAEWYRVLKVGGFLVLTVPHQWLYERKATIPSRFNTGHQRFYTPASLMAEVERSLPVGAYRVRILRDNDEGFSRETPPHLHAQGCYEIELVLEKVKVPPYASLLTLSPKARAIIDTYVTLIRGTIEARSVGRPVDVPTLERFGAALPIPPYALLRELFPEIPDGEFRPVLRPMVDMTVVDSEWYLARYNVVKTMIEAGLTGSAGQHYRADGYFQHYRPAPSDELYG
jgi:SAM-dependent methyltransferase